MKEDVRSGPFYV